MKVLFINTVYKRGSTGRIVFDLGQMLGKKGYEFKAAYGRGVYDDDPHCFRIGNDIDMCIHAGLSRITDKAGYYSKHATQELLNFIREYNPDIIHLHNLHGYYLNIIDLFHFLAKEYKGRVIWTLHDCWPFTGHCTHYTYAQCEKWKTGCYQCREKKRYPTSYIIDNSRNNYNVKKNLFTSIPNMQIVCPSNWLKRQVESSFLKKYPSTVINNGIDTGVFCPNNQVEREDIVLNVLDGLDVRKGYVDFFRLAERLHGKYTFMLVGLQNRDLKRLPSYIVGVVRTKTPEELVKYYQSARYFVNTTYEDTFPTVNLEALACGLPIITYDSGGSKEVVTDRTGFVVKPGDINGITSILKSKIRIESDECRNEALAYEKGKKYDEYYQLYCRLIGNR